MESILIVTLVYFIPLFSVIHRKNKEIRYYKEVIRIQNESILEDALKGGADNGKENQQ